MGHIHETESKIFAIETRSESANLFDISEGGKHLFFSHRRACSVRDDISKQLMKKAGEFFGKGDTKNAEKYKELAEIVTTIEPYDYPVNAVEATYEWIRDLVAFCTTNEGVSKELTASRG